MIKENLFEHPKCTLKQLFLLLHEDNIVRLKFMHKKPGFGNALVSYLSPSMGAVVLFRFAHYFYCKRITILSRFFYAMNIVIFGCDITPPSKIGPGLHVAHVVAVAIHGQIGKNALIYGQATIGGSGDGSSKRGWLGGPVIGDNFTIGFGAKVLACVDIGDNVFIGAMSLVTKDVPDNAFMFGIPAKVMRIREKPGHRYDSEII
jgi:serine O-acetyltransferase